MTRTLMWLAALMAVLAAVASSDALVHLHEICVHDIGKVCSTDRDLIPLMSCLTKHHADLSSECKAAVEKCPAFKCSDDLLQFCPKVMHHHDFTKCMHQHRHQLSAACPYSTDELSKVDKEGKCKEDRRKFCSDVHGLVHLMKCMKDHHDQLAKDCAAAIDKCPAFDCLGDALKYCPDVETHHDFTACLWNHRDELSSECKVHHVHQQHTNEFDNPENACYADRTKLCAAETKLVPTMSCLVKHEAQLSPNCRQAIENCPGFGCVDDAARFCPDVATQHDFLSCIWKHLHELSPKCQHVYDIRAPAVQHSSRMQRFGFKVPAGILNLNGGLKLHSNYIRAAILGTSASILLTILGMFAWRRYRRKETPTVVVEPIAEYRRI